MRVLVTGGYGFIGTAVCAALITAGHQVVGAGRNVKWARRRFPDLQWVHCDFNHDLNPEDWTHQLANIDAVVNCVGVLQDGGSDNTQNAHSTGLQALLSACEQAGLQKFIHLSAVGADPAAGTKYSRTKFEGAERVKKSKLNWVILEPSLVLDRTVYGGSAIIRTLAGLPVCIPLVYGQTKFQPVSMQDVTRIVTHFLEPASPSKIQIEIAGPQTLTLQQIVSLVRNWLGFGPAKFINIPTWVAAPVFIIGDALGAIGVRTALRSTAKKQMQYGVGGDPAPLQNLIGYQTNSIASVFSSNPASLGDRLQARLSSIIELSRIGLAWYWILSGLIPLLFSKSWALEILADAGFAEPMGSILFWGGSMADIVLGSMLLLGIQVRRVCWAMVAISVGYLVMISLCSPHLWLDPMATVLKIFPAMALAVIIAGMADQR